MESNRSSIGLLLLLLICSLNAAVIKLNQGDTCSNTCSGKDTVLKFQENKIYIYNFISKHSIKNPNSKEETLQLELQGKAKVSKISDCDFVLLLSDVNLKEFIKEKPTINKEYQMMKTLLEKYTLRFGYDNGRVTGVCQDDLDNEFAVNIKKGILSSLQVSLDSLDAPNYLTETDIAGDCLTEYSTQSEPPNFVIITKKKSIAGCSRKTKYFTTISGRIHEVPKESRNLALLDGSYSCEIKIKRSDGIKETICQETHTFKPIKSEIEGSQILINQELRFDSLTDGNLNAKVPTIRSDLTMKHGDKEPIFMKEKLNDPKTVLKEVCSTFKESAISSTITELFLRLIRSLSGSTYEDIKALYKFIGEDAVCNLNTVKIRSLLLDVLSNVKTDTAFKFLIEDAKIYKFTKLGFSIFDNPTLGMIATLTKSLKLTDSYNTVSTLLSSMIKSYCIKNKGCMVDPEIIKAMEIFTNNIGENCHHTDKKVVLRITYSLRSLSNAGSHPNFDKLIKTIKACVMSKTSNDDIRVYSVQVFRQFPCNENVDKFIWSIFDDVSYSSEIRIEAYLSLVRCPTRSIYGQIIQRLENEQSQQLGSFIWSHISNLMESSDRFKTDIRDMLQIYTKPINELEKKFNLDFRSYSKNIEKTFQRGYSAAKMDTNIIYSSSSPIPSSLNINATFEIFGRSINLFEIGVRGKGISDKLFGGDFQPTAQDKLHPGVKKMHQKISKKADKLSISFYSKIMGREVYFTPNILSDLSTSVINLSTKPSFERSLLLLDTTISVSSISGFPVELQLESAASVNLNLMKNKDFSLNNIELSAKSNYAVQITGKLLVNSHCTKIGVQSKAILSKDVEFGGKIKLRRGVTDSDYEFELNKIPDNSKLFSISNELSLIHKLDKVQTIEKYDTKLEGCTGEGVMKIMGLKVCISYKTSPKLSSFLPNFKADVTFDKFSGLKLLWKMEESRKPVRKLKSYILSASFPGAKEDSFRFKIDRDLSAKRQIYELLLWKKQSYMKFEINKNKISGELKSGKTEATMSGTLEDKGIFASVMNIDIKSNANTAKLIFSQKFTKEGPEVTLKLTKDGDKGFDLLSTTKIRLTKHKIFDYFQRFRHSTNLKYSGENEFSLVIENTQANKPLTEAKSQIVIFWKTKQKRNFYMNQVYFWQNVAHEDTSELFGKVTGRKYSVQLDHEIEVKDQKFNVTNNFEYFTTGSLDSIGNKPKIVFIMFKREDIIKKETLIEVKSRFGLEINKKQDLKYMMENILNYPAMKINRKLNSKVTLLRNKLGLYDIEAEFKGTLLQLSFNHKFTSTQNGITAAELIIGESSYKINSHLNLPNGHKLLISWPGNNFEINSNVIYTDAKTVDLTINHDLKMNNKLLAKIKNSIKFNNYQKDMRLISIGKTSDDKIIYSFDFERNLNFDFSKIKISYDYKSKATLNIPGNNYNKVLIIEQFADLDYDGKITYKEKSFKSKVILQDLNKQKIAFGYELNVIGEKDVIQYQKVNAIFYKDNNENKMTFKFGRKNMNILIGISVDFQSNFEAEIMSRIIIENKKINCYHLLFINSKKNPEKNLYYKQNVNINWETNNAFLVKIKAEYGKVKSNTTPLSLTISGKYQGFKKLGVDFNIDSKEIKVNHIFNYNFEDKKTGYYQLTLNNNLKYKFIRYMIDTSYDLNMNVVLDLVKKDKGIGSGEISINAGEKFAKLKMDIKLKENKEKQANLKITTSNELFKELKVRMEETWNAKTSSVSVKMELKSKSENYNLNLKRQLKAEFQEKIDLIELINWSSNIPYISSGSASFGVLLQGKIFQCNLNIIYQELKIIDLKIETSDITKNLNILFMTNTYKSIKFQTKYKIDNTIFTFELDTSSDNKFVKIPKLELVYQRKGNFITTSSDIVIKTSNKAVEDITINTQTNLDLGNILKTFRRKAKIQLNGKILDYINIDLDQGIIELLSNSGKYIKGLGFQTYEMNIKYKFETIRNFMIEYKSILNGKPLTDLNLIYFRSIGTEPSKKVDSMGEAMFFLNIIYNRQASNAKMIVFIDKDKSKAVMKIQAALQLIGFKLDEVIMTFRIKKGSDTIYTGDVKYKGNQYSFSYEKSVGYKRKLQIKANDKSTKPQELIFSFDFNKDYILKLLVDDYFDFNVALKLIEMNSHSGLIKFVYKGNEIMNLKTKFKIIIPKTATTTYAFMKVLFGVESGFDFNLEIDGSVNGVPVKSKTAISHVPSSKLPGGIQSNTLFNIEIKNVDNYKFSLENIMDYNFPKVYIDQKVVLNISDKIVFKKKGKIVFISWQNMHFEQLLLTRNEEHNFMIINNEKIVKVNMNYKIAGIGFEYLKETFAISLYKLKDGVNAKFETNIGYLIKNLYTYGKLNDIGKEYYIKCSYGVKAFEFRMNKKSNNNCEFKYNEEDGKMYSRYVLNTFNEWKTRNELSYELKGETSKENIKYFTLTSNLKFTDQFSKMILTSILNVNKNDVAVLELNIKSNKNKSPYELKLKYKGSYLISGEAMLDVKNIKFSHSLVVSDSKFKTQLWSSASGFKLKGGLDCFLNHINKAREINMGIKWTQKLKKIEFTWNKKKERGFLFMREIDGQNRKTTISSPLRTVKITKIKKTKGGQLFVEITRKVDPSKPVTFSLDYLMTGSLKTDYTLDLLLNSNLFTKPLKISINRQVSMNIGDIYTLNIKAIFDGDKKALFTLEGYLRQLSARSYEMMLNATTIDKYITLTTKTSFTAEELSFEYKVDQRNEKSKEFIFKFVPFKKFLITNNNDFKILISKSVYQYGFRRDIIFKLGKKGPNRVAYATFNKTPFKYYAEVNGNGKKLVIHFRSVENGFLGEIYRNVDGIKMMDMLVKGKIDFKNILSINHYWNPKSLDAYKNSFKTIFEPDNIRALLINAYESIDNRWSPFLSEMKMNFIRNVNIPNIVDFAKNVQNDIEQIPNAIAESYDDDNFFIKSFMDSLYDCLKTINFQETFNKFHKKMTASATRFSTKVYEFLTSAKIYTSIYNFINNKLNSITYDGIRNKIEIFVRYMKMVTAVIKIELNRIGIMLDKLSELASRTYSKSSTFAKNIASAYEGSKVKEMITLLRQIKTEILNGLGQVMDTEFIKQRMVYYKEAITNVKDFLQILINMKTEIFKYMKSTSVFGNILETMKLIKTMKYKKAFFNMIKPEKASFQMNLDIATMNMTIYVPPIIKPILKMYNKISYMFPSQIISNLQGAGINRKIVALFYRYEYLVFNYGSLEYLRKLLPPFKKTAWIIGGTSVLTYDGSSIKIGSGKCSYLLARDIKFGSLSLIMNIESEKKTKEYVLSYINTIKILSTGKITVNEKTLESLPQQISSKGKSIEIYRDHDIIKIQTSEGFTMEYFFNLDYLKVTLSGNWHGSMMGLLGSNDFDIINDWSTPDGRITHDAGILSKSWSIGKCNSGTKTGLYTVHVDGNKLLGCKNRFMRDSQSYLTRCFSLIDPAPYFELCRMSLQYNQMSEKQYKNFICDLSRNYVIRCKSKGMMIRLEKSCINCGSIKLGGRIPELSLKFKPKFNFIFIIEQSICLKPYKSLMDELLNMMALQEDNLFTLITFNGQGIFKSSHFKSINNDITSNKKKFKTLLDELRSPLQISTITNLNSSSEGSQAIYDAIKMPSQKGFIEKIIFISCSACKEHKRYLFPVLAQMLNNAGISITYLTTQSFTGQGSTPDTAGLGKKMVHYFEKNSLKTRVWTKNLQPPNNVCSHLAQFSNGIVWSLNSLNSKMRIRRLAEKLHTELINVKGNPKQSCLCGTGNNENGKMECKVRG